MRKLNFLVALLLLAPVAQAKTLDEMLAEKGVIAKGEMEAAGGAAKVWWDNGTKVEFPDNGFSTKISTTIQTRYEFTDSDSADNTSSFEINKARLKVSGSAVNKEWDYALQAGFNEHGGAKSPELLDAYLTWHANDWMWAKMGQYKTGISRGYNTSDEKLMFADRSVVSDYFDLGRSQGLSIGGDADSLTWGLAAFNGESTGEGLNSSGTDTDHTFVASLRYNAMGEMDAFSESDVAWTDDAALNMGVAYSMGQATSAAGDFDRDVVNADVNFKYQGWGMNLEGFYGNLDPDAGSEIKPWGVYAQAGYFVDPKKTEVAARYGYVDCDNGSDSLCTGDTVEEINVSLNHYWWAHHLKAQLGWSHLNQDSGSDEEKSNRYLLQLSSWF